MSGTPSTQIIVVECIFFTLSYHHFVCRWTDYSENCEDYRLSYPLVGDIMGKCLSSVSTTLYLLCH